MEIVNCVFLVIIISAPVVYAQCRTSTCTSVYQYPCSVCRYENLENVTALEFSGNRIEVTFVDCHVGTFSADSLSAEVSSRIILLSIERGEIEFIEDGALENYKNLRDIRFKNNNISSLPDYAFKGLNVLTKVDFSSNQLVKIGEKEFTNATAITKLNLSNNRIVSFCVKQLIRLEELNLENNRIAVLDELPKTLKTVRLSFNRLAKILNGTFYNTSLSTLDFAHNNISTIESGAFEKSKSLQYVDLSFNNLTEWSNLLNSTNLRRLNLTGNKITELKGKLANTSVIFTTFQLILQQNQLVSFSAENFNVGVKSEVDLSQNLIEELDKSDFNVSVRILDFNLARNKIMKLPSGFFSKQSTIKTLNLSANFIEQLEIGSFVGLSSLERLDLSGNRIRTLYELVFINTPNLNRLNLGDNNLASLNGYEIVEITHLNVIELEGNKFSCLDLANLIRQFKKDKVRVVYGANRDVAGINGISCDNPEGLTLKTTTETITNVEIQQILHEIKEEVAIISDKSEAGILTLILLFVIVLTVAFLYTIFIKRRTTRRRFAITDEEEESIM